MTKKKLKPSKYEKYGQQTRTATVQKTLIPLENQGIDEVFPGNYKNQLKGESQFVDDTNPETINKDSLPLDNGTSTKTGYIMETDNSEDNEAGDEINDDELDFSEFDNLDYTGDVKIDDSLKSMDSSKPDVDCSN